MADDQNTPQVPPQDDPGYSHEDLQNESLRDIASNTETPKDEPETPAAPAEPEEEPVDFDEERRKIAEETAQRTLDEQEARRVAQEEAQAAEAAKNTPDEDEYAAWEKELWEKEKRNPTYREALNFMSEQAEKRIDQKQQEKLQAKQEEQEKIQAQRAEEAKRINAFVDDELSDLYKENKLTPIKDPANPSDPGVMERKAFFAQWAEVNAQRRKDGKPEIISATRIHNFYFKKPNVQPAGADAPVSGNRGSTVTPAQEQEYTYEDVRKPWSFFKK